MSNPMPLSSEDGPEQMTPPPNGADPAEQQPQQPPSGRPQPGPRPPTLWKPTQPPKPPKPPKEGSSGWRPPQLSPAVGPIVSHHSWTGRLAQPHLRIAQVLVHQKGDHEVIWPTSRQRPRTGTAQVMPRRPSVVYDVDLGQHQKPIKADLRSADRGCSFHAIMTVQWRVLDPSEVIRHFVTDVTEVLRPDLLRRAEAITRKMPIVEFSAAEDQINEELNAEAIDTTDPAKFKEALESARKKSKLGAEYGLWTRVIVQLAPDEAAAAHLIAITKLNWEIQEEKAKHELRKLQEEHKQEITLDRVDLYRDIVAAGDIDRFALQLANNPEDVAALHKIIRDELQASREDTINFVTHMVDSGVIERWEVSDQVKETLQFIQMMSSRVIRTGSQQQQEPAQVPSYLRRRQDRGTVIQGKISEEDATRDEPADNDSGDQPQAP